GHLAISSPLPPGALADLFGVRVTRVESLPPGIDETLTGAVPALRLLRWRERLELSPAAQAAARFADGSAALVRCGRTRYLAGCTDEAGWRVLLEQAAADAGLATEALPMGLRISALGELRIACNFSAAAVAWRPAQRATPLLGGERIAPCDVAIWKVEAR
ncbi:MAG: beta-galactosidase trimerization domain-containing protein, partial [Pseudomonadota bacterium]|nr:beta-galactosidase trimerization domain-containing protein [Pseudomonadota bacterium]